VCRSYGARLVTNRLATNIPHLTVLVVDLRWLVNESNVFV